MPFYVYLLASKRQGTLYLGVTRNLARRVWQHKQRETPGFTSRYGVDRLVWYEPYERMDEAIAREKALKKWRRAWKIALIEAMNPEWRDLYQTLNTYLPHSGAAKRNPEPTFKLDMRTAS